MKGPLAAMGLVLLGTVGAISYSHYAQVRDKAVMRAGVERDKERLRSLQQQQQQVEPRERRR